MFKGFILVFYLVTGLIGFAQAQIVRQFEVNEKNGVNLVNFDFFCYKGVSSLQRDYLGIPLRARAELGKVNILPAFSHDLTDGVLNAHLEHKNVESESLGRNLSYKLFSGKDADFDHKWDIGLDANYLYNLNLNFGIGKANLDFSNLPISNCKIKTASTDVFLAYSKKIPNSVMMDSLLITINMGSIYAEDLHYSNARNLIFDVNYGSVNLSFSDMMAEASQISTIVGAGSVNIRLPSENLPYLVKIKSTAMCRTKVPKHLKEVGNKTYVSRGYREEAKNLMTFLIDVSVGSVSLE
ncbi:hypothetical protein [Negadavirga shengliensis]|uniref:Adhesin domain-containing protein n=1 Tax=Negadavirga shengliensis TaxID=1389218 RepID=A0ABV9SY26_9BACT